MKSFDIAQILSVLAMLILLLTIYYKLRKRISTEEVVILSPEVFIDDL